MLNFGNKEFRNLQEQVLKNAQDIETLKGRENLQIVIVEELPEEGNPNYIYLVPNEDGDESNVYNEYIWLADEEAYEQIGAVNIDLTNYVTTNTEQEITGAKSYTTDLVLKTDSGDSPALIFQRGTNNDSLNDWRIIGSSGYLRFSTRTAGTWQEIIQITATSFQPLVNNAKDLGASGTGWKDLYLTGFADFGNDAKIQKDSSNRINILYNNSVKVKVGNQDTYFATNVSPDSNNNYSLGGAGAAWKNIYIAGYISDGVNSVTVANISTKTTSTYASGTFDASGQDTIDISGGTPEGLFIFSYGNCQCLVHLTATMVQNADLTPIRVSCPMINNSNAKNGWLAISRSGTTLTIEVVDDDAQEHVDSGYSWTLVKTGLI